MLIVDYIKQTFMDFGVRLSDAAVDAIMLRNELDASTELSAANMSKVDAAIVKSLPILLAAPASISEGALLITKAQHESIVLYYRLRCKELDIPSGLE